jgi:hypothetical protein
MVNKFIRRGKVLNVDGASQPGTLKIRAYPEGIDEQALNNTNFTEWSTDDPYVFISLLPIFFNQAPNVGETVLLFYSNPIGMTFQDQYWMHFSPSNILNIGGETYEQTLSNTGLGDNIAQPKALVGPKSNVKGSALNNGNPKLINQKIEGVFPKTNEIAVMGRGTSDMILGDSSLLLRAGKVYEFLPNVIPARNFNRAFINLSHFKEKVVKKEQPNRFIYNENTSIPVKKCIIYDVINLESDTSIGGTFSGNISIYDLLENDKTLSSNLTKDTDLSDCISPVARYTYTFHALPLLSATTLINTFLDKSFNELGLIDLPFYPNYQIGEPRFPIFFTFGTNISNGLRSSNPTISKNSNDFINNVKYYTKSTSSIVYGKNVVVPIPKFKIQTVYESKVEKINETYGTMAANTLYFLSHNSSIDNKKINLTNTIDNLNISDLESFKNSTNSMVRGEKLIELLELIVAFLLSHVHNPNEEPDGGPYNTVTNISSQTVRDALSNAKNVVLNQNIRIN